MESRLKERLTGAAILVALIVLIVPEVFHGRHGATPPQPAGAQSQSLPTPPTSPVGSTGPAASPVAPLAPTRSYTIDLTNTPAPASARPSTPASAPTSDTASKPALPPDSAAPASSAARGAESGPEIGLPSEPAHHPGLRATHHEGSADGWIVQLGLFAKQGNAERLAHTAQGKGVSASVTRFGPRGCIGLPSPVWPIARQPSRSRIACRMQGYPRRSWDRDEDHVAYPGFRLQ